MYGSLIIDPILIRHLNWFVDFLGQNSEWTMFLELSMKFVYNLDYSVSSCLSKFLVCILTGASKLLNRFYLHLTLKIQEYWF